MANNCELAWVNRILLVLCAFTLHTTRPSLGSYESQALVGKVPSQAAALLLAFLCQQQSLCYSQVFNYQQHLLYQQRPPYQYQFLISSSSFIICCSFITNSPSLMEVPSLVAAPSQMAPPSLVATSLSCYDLDETICVYCFPSRCGSCVSRSAAFAFRGGDPDRNYACSKHAVAMTTIDCLNSSNQQWE